MKSYRFDFTGGVNVVGDKAVMKETFVTVADNCFLRSGAPRGIKMPTFSHTPPAGTTQIFEFRGKWYYSSVERSYVAEYVGGRDRIFYTQYGGNPRKIVDGVEVPLGTKPPGASAQISAGTTIKTTPTVTVLDGGSFAANRNRSYRIAVETVNGILPPGERVLVTTPSEVSGTPYVSKYINLTWPRVESAVNYMIFAGDGSEESLLERVGAGTLSYNDYGTKGTTGDLASNYEVRAPYAYFHTYERFVNGMEDESAPSPLTTQVEANLGRTLTFDPVGEGFYYQEGSVNITTGITITDSATPAAIDITTVTYQPSLNQVQFDTLAAHGLATNDRARIDLASDPNWTAVEYPIIADPTVNTRFYVKGGVIPTGTTGTARASKFQVDLGATPTTPVQTGDVVYMLLGNAKGYNDLTITYACGKATRVSDTQFYVQTYVDNLAAGAVTCSSLRYVPKNGYIRYRNVYRTGDSDAFQLVKQLPINELTMVDDVSATNLGDLPDSYYTENGITVIYAMPPLGMEGVIRHYDMLAGIDGHKVRWTPNGRPDAWPTDFYYDFASKPIELASFAQSLIVLCEDALYRIDGNIATDLSQTKTRAENGCIAPGTVQKTHAGLVYLSNRGLMVFDGMDARCLTDQKIPGKFFTHPSVGADSIYSVGYFDVQLQAVTDSWLVEE